MKQHSVKPKQVEVSKLAFSNTLSATKESAISDEFFAGDENLGRQKLRPICWELINFLSTSVQKFTVLVWVKFESRKSFFFKRDIKKKKKNANDLAKIKNYSLNSPDKNWSYHDLFQVNWLVQT